MEKNLIVLCWCETKPKLLCWWERFFSFAFNCFVRESCSAALVTLRVNFATRNPLENQKTPLLTSSNPPTPLLKIFLEAAQFLPGVFLFASRYYHQSLLLIYQPTSSGLPLLLEVVIKVNCECCRGCWRFFCHKFYTTPPTAMQVCLGFEGRLGCLLVLYMVVAMLWLVDVFGGTCRNVLQNISSWLAPCSVISKSISHSQVLQIIDTCKLS